MRYYIELEYIEDKQASSSSHFEKGHQISRDMCLLGFLSYLNIVT